MFRYDLVYVQNIVIMSWGTKIGMCSDGTSALSLYKSRYVLVYVMDIAIMYWVKKLGYAALVPWGCPGICPGICPGYGYHHWMGR